MAPILVAALLVLPWGAHAQQRVQMTSADCQRLVRHTPSADVAYQPGVDVNGNAVASADLNGGTQIAVPDSFTIPITIDLGDRLGIPVNGDKDYLARFAVGEVKVNANGHVTYNGQPLTDSAAHDLAKQCQQVLGRR